jgi:hypothetical protein
MGMSRVEMRTTLYFPLVGTKQDKKVLGTRRKLA